MHFKLFLSCLVLGACTATTLYGGDKYITVNHDGSYIQVASDNGMKIKIVKNRLGGLLGLKNFDITLTGHDFYKNIHIDNQVGGDVVFDLFAQHQGVIDDVTFQKLLYKLEHYVQQGDVHPKIFHMFQCLVDHQLVHTLNFEDLMGQNYYWRNQGLYNKEYYPYHMYQGKYGMSHIYGQNYYTPSFWNQVAYKTHMPYHYGSYTPSIWNQVYQHQMPFYKYQGLDRDVTYGRNMIENEIEREIEREVEREVTPYQYGLYHKNTMYPKTQQYYGMNRYGYNNYFGDYLRQVLNRNSLYDVTPMHYNTLMGTHMRLPMTVY